MDFELLTHSGCLCNSVAVCVCNYGCVCVIVVCDVFTIHVFNNLCMQQLNRLSYSTSSFCISSVLVIALSCLVLLLMWIDYILLALGLIVLLTTKSQGQKHTNHPNIPNDSFLLILQTNFQLELHKKTCINKHVFRLHSWNQSIQSQADHSCYSK